MVTNDSSATYPSPCAQRDASSTSLLTQHHLLRTCLSVPHTVSDDTAWDRKAARVFGGLYLALNLRLTPVQMWDLLLLGRCHVLKLSSGSHSPNYHSGLLTTFSKEKISRTKPVLPAITTRGRPQDVATWQQGPEQCTPVYCSICTPVFSGVREECVPAHPGQACSL